MTAVTEQWVSVGSRFPVRLIVEQSQTLQTHAAKPEEAAALAASGFSAARRTELAQSTTELEAAIASQRQVQDALPQHTALVNMAQGRAKRLLRRLAVAAKNALEEQNPEALREFTPKGVLGRSVPRLVSHLLEVTPAATRHATALAEWGFGPQYLQELNALMAALRDGDGVQEAKKKDLPAETRALHAAAGKVYMQLKRLVRTGRLAHDGNPAKAAAYNLDILRREGRPAPVTEGTVG